MDPTKRKKLEAAGWKVGTAEEFLGLSPEEAAYIDLKLALSRGLKRLRMRKKITQKDLADQIGSSQSRIAKAEAGDPGVSIDLMVKALLATGARITDVARLLNKETPDQAT